MKVLMSSPQYFLRFISLPSSSLPADKTEVIPQLFLSASTPISECHCNAFDIDSLNKTSKCNTHISTILNDGEKKCYF